MNRRQQLETLLDELLRGVQDVLMSGEILSDEFQSVIAQEIETLVNEIDQLRTENIPVQENVPPLESPMPSSNVNSFGYNPDTEELYVKFQGDYPLENGPVYKYGGVPKVIFDLFQKGSIPARTDGKNEWGEWWKGKVPSLGSSLYTLIKQAGYPYERLT